MRADKLKPGDLVRLSEGIPGRTWFTVGAYDGAHDFKISASGGGFTVPDGSVALVLRIEACPKFPAPEDHRVHVLVNGRAGWVYPEDGEVIST